VHPVFILPTFSARFFCPGRRTSAPLRSRVRQCLPFLLLGGIVLLSGCEKARETESVPALVNRGWENFRLGEFELAVADFQAAERIAEGKDRAGALFGEASCWQYRRDGRDTARADQLYSELLASAGEDVLAPWSELARIRIRHFGQIEPPPDYEALAGDYGALYQRHPGHPAGQEALVNRFAIELFDAAKAPNVARKSVPALEAFLKDHPGSPFQSAVRLHLATCYQAMGQPEESLQWRIRAFESRESNVANPNANESGSYWTIARAARFEAGNFAVARQYFQKLISEYPNDQRIFEARRALSEMEQIEEFVRAGGNPADWREGIKR